MNHWSNKYEQHKQSKIYFHLQYDEKKSFCRKFDKINFIYVKFTIRFNNSLQSYKFDFKKKNINKKIFDNCNEIWTFYMQNFKTKISHKNEKKIFYV